MSDWVRGPDSRVRRAVVVGAKSAARTRRPEWAEPLLDLLEPALKDENEYVRKNLGPFTIGDQFLRSYPDATLARLRKWMEDPDENVRWNVAMAFAAASGARLAQRAPDILDFLAKDERPLVRNAVRAARRRVRTLAACGGDALRGPAARALGGPRVARSDAGLEAVPAHRSAAPRRDRARRRRLRGRGRAARRGAAGARPGRPARAARLVRARDRRAALRRRAAARRRGPSSVAGTRERLRSGGRPRDLGTATWRAGMPGGSRRLRRRHRVRGLVRTHRGACLHVRRAGRLARRGVTRARPISCLCGGRSRHRESRAPHRVRGPRSRQPDAVTTPYELVIGIETHVELATASKMFCGCKARWFGAPPNTLVCPVCLGLPGALPVPNRKAIELAITAGVALHCETPEHTKFDRKNYLYPDLPKGYQISQYDLPLSVNGWLELASGKRVRIRRAHLEEDTGTLKHGEDAGRRYTLVDYNRSGVPLLEIVSEPDMSSIEEAETYVRELRDILRAAHVSEMRLEEGAGRFDVNVSIRFSEDGTTVWPPQSEIKNLNSYQALREATAFEAARLWDEWRAGGELRTRKGKITVGWSPERRRTYLQRSKEEVEDYRYFPEPDLVSLEPSRETVKTPRAGPPATPSERKARVVSKYGLSEYDARILVTETALADFYEAAVAALPAHPKPIANWMTGELLRRMREENVDPSAIRFAPDALAALVRLVESGKVSGASAKAVLVEMWQTGGDPAAIVNTKGLPPGPDQSAIPAAAAAVLGENPNALAASPAGH